MCNLELASSYNKYQGEQGTCQKTNILAGLGTGLCLPSQPVKGVTTQEAVVPVTQTSGELFIMSDEFCVLCERTVNSRHEDTISCFSP